MTNPKLAFAAVLLGFQVQLFTPPALSSGHHAGGHEIAQTTTETPTPEAAEAGKSGEETDIHQTQANMNEQLAEYQKQFDRMFSQLEQKKEELIKQTQEIKNINKNFKINADKLLKQIENNAKEDVEKILAKIRKDSETIGKTLVKINENEKNTRKTLNKAKKTLTTAITDIKDKEEEIKGIEKTLTRIEKDADKIKDEVKETLKQAQENAKTVKEDLTQIQKDADEIKDKAKENLVQVEADADIVKRNLSQIQTDAEKAFDRYEKLEAGISEMRGQIKAIAIFGSVAAVLVTILLSPLVSKILALVELSPDRLKKHEERIDKLEEKIENR